MMPWKDQLRLGWRILRWMYCPAGWHAWANTGLWIVSVAISVAIYEQLWLAVLAGFVLGVAIALAGRKAKT